MAVSYIGSAAGTPTNGSAPGAITPHASTQTGDLIIFYHFSKINTNGTQSVTLPTGFTSIYNNRDANGLIACGWKIRQAGDTSYQATVANHTSGTSGDSIVEFVETWRGTHTTAPIGAVGSGFTNGTAALTVGPITVPAGTIAIGNAIKFFWGKEENTSSQTLLTGDSLTWATGGLNDTTAGADASCGSQHGINASAGAVTPTNKTITTAGTTATSRAVSFTIVQAPAPTSTSVGEVSLASHDTPSERTNHSLRIRARLGTATQATVRAALYEGATNRSGDLESSALTSSFAWYDLAIPDASAANITDYSNLGVRFWAYSSTASTGTVEIADIEFVAPEGTEIGRAHV